MMTPMTPTDTRPALTALAAGLLGLGLGGVAAILGPVTQIPALVPVSFSLGFAWPAGLCVGLVLAAALLRTLPRPALAAAISSLVFSLGIALSFTASEGQDLLLNAPLDPYLQFGTPLLLVVALVTAAQACPPPALAALLGAFSAAAVFTLFRQDDGAVLVTESDMVVGTGRPTPPPVVVALVAILVGVGAIGLVFTTRRTQVVAWQAWTPIAVFAVVQCAAVACLAIRPSDAVLVALSLVAGLVGIGAAWWLGRGLPSAWTWFGFVPGLLVPVSIGMLEAPWRLAGAAVAATCAVGVGLTAPRDGTARLRAAVLVVAAPLWWFTVSVAATSPPSQQRYADYFDDYLDLNALVAASNVQVLLALACVAVGAVTAWRHGRRSRR